MLIWILGKNGLLGSTLHALCQKRKIPCFATGQEDADIADLETLKKYAKKATHIVNCAALTHVDLAEKEVELAFAVNAKGPENLGKIARVSGAKVIHVSTDYVFGGERQVPYLETDLCHPLSIYAKSKWEGENRLLQQLPTACIIRTSWVFGKRGKNFISTLFDRLKKEQKLQVDATHRGRATYVVDLASALLDLLCHSGIFHFANRQEISRYEIAQEIFQKGKERGVSFSCQEITPIASVKIPWLAERPAYSVLNTDKVERLLGKPIRSWKESVTEYVDAL